MDIFSKNRLMGWLVVILVILNLGMLITFWVSRPRGPHPDGRKPDKNGINMERPGNPGEFLETELGFNDEQSSRYKELRKEHREKADEIISETRKLKDSFFELLSQPDADSGEVTEMANEIGAKQTELDLLTFNHFKEVRAICTDEQKKKFDDIIEEVLKGMAGTKNGPPGNRRGPRGEGPPGRNGPPDRKGPPGRNGPPPGR